MPSSFLAPQESVEFSEYWMPVREIGGIAHANLHAIVNFEHGSNVRLAMNVTHAIENGRVRIRDGSRVVAEDRVPLVPARTYFRELLPGPTYTVELIDASGEVLLAHTEGEYDMAKPSEVKPGPQPGHVFPPPEQRTDGDFMEIGTDHELNGRNLLARDEYAAGLKRFPDSFELHKAAGRLGVTLLRYEEAVEHLLRAQVRRNNDPDIHYHLGICYAALGEPAKARAEFDQSQLARVWRAPARLELAFLDAQQGRLSAALEWTRRAAADSPDAVRLGAVEVALLRRSGRVDVARERLAHWRKLDPTSAALRFEGTLLGAPDEELWEHLAADPERVLEVAADYMRLAMYEDAVRVLGRQYPAVNGARTEPGAVLPQQHPLVAYYRGYCRERLGQSGLEDYRVASGLPTRYVFPNRADTRPVLQSAIAANSQDATAHFLLGSLWMAGGIVDRAVAEWEKARGIRAAIPTLHRNLGYTYLMLKHDAARAAAILREGLGADPDNVALYTGLDQALSVLEQPSAERAEALGGYPDPAGMPAVLVYARALALAEAGQHDKARELFFNRFFAMEEFGTQVAQPYLEVELLRIRGLLRAGKRTEARAAINTLGKEVPGLPFTKDGLAQFLEGTRYQYELGELAAEMGDTAGAAVHWKRAAAGRAQTPFLLMAEKRLNAGDPAAWRSRLEAALRQAEAALATTTSPGMAHFTRGVLLRELGRKEEARDAFRSAILTRDRGLSQYLGRVGLNSLRAE